MQVIVNCQRCNGALTVTPEMGGRVFACPYCAQQFTAPQLVYPQQPPPSAPPSPPRPPGVPPTMAPPPRIPPVLPPVNAAPNLDSPFSDTPSNTSPFSNPSRSTMTSARKQPRYVDEVNIGLGIAAALILLISFSCPVISLPFSGGISLGSIIRMQLADGFVNHVTLAAFLLFGAAVLAFVLALLRKFQFISISAAMAGITLLIMLNSYRHPSAKYGFGMAVILVGALAALAAAFVRVRKV